MKNIIYAIAVLAGTIIGVALFSLPYLTLQVGWGTMLFYFLLVGGLMILLHLFFGELVLHTPDGKRLPGIAEYYWGKKGKYLTLISHSGALLGAILAYILVGGGFLHELFLVNGFDFSFFGAILLFWGAGAFIMFRGSSALNILQVIGVVSFILILGTLFWLGREEATMVNLFAQNGDSVNWFAPYGVMIFALWGASLIPLIEDILKKQKKQMQTVIIISIILPILVYLVFIGLVLSISGAQTEPSALVSLKNQLETGAYSLILLFGIITTFTSYTAIGLTMTQVLELDVKFKKITAWLVTIFLPVGFYILGVRDFLEVVVFVGSIFLAFDGLNMLLMYKKRFIEIKFWKKISLFVLILVLLSGIGYEVFSLIS